MASRASQMVIDGATLEAIQAGQLDLSHASPALQQIAIEAGFGVRRKRRGFFDMLFGSGESDHEDYAAETMARILTDMELTKVENQRRAEEHAKWVADNRGPKAPRNWQLLTSDGRVQSYSDGGRIIYTNRQGVPLSESDQQAELNRRYGCGD